MGIGFILGTLCHALFTFRWGIAHYTMLFSGVLAIIYALIQMYRRNSYAPHRDKKIDGFDILGIIVGMALAILIMAQLSRQKFDVFIMN